MRTRSANAPRRPRTEGAGKRETTGKRSAEISVPTDPARDFGWWRRESFVEILSDAQIPVIWLRTKKKFPMNAPMMKFVFSDSRGRFHELGSAFGKEAVPERTSAGVLVFDRIEIRLENAFGEKHVSPCVGWLFPEGVWTGKEMMSLETAEEHAVSARTMEEAVENLEMWMRMSALERAGGTGEAEMAWIAYAYSMNGERVPELLLTKKGRYALEEARKACGTVTPEMFAALMTRG